MKWVILLLFLLSSFLFFSAILQFFFLSNKRLDKRIKRYLDMGVEKKLPRKKINILLQMQLYKQVVKDRVLTKQKNEKLEEQLRRAGLTIKPEEYILFQWISIALCGGLLILISGNVFMLLIGAIGGYMLPKFWMKKKEKERIEKFNDGLDDMITTMIGSLRAGFSFVQAFKTVADESESPMKDEIETMLREMQYGTNVEDALQHLKERMPSDDLDLVIQSILIQRQVGGNLAVVLETIVQTIRDRNKIQRQIRTLTAQGRLSGIVIGFLPIALGLILYLIEPTYIGTLFSHPIGIGMVIGAAISGGIGLVLIRKVTTIEV